MSYEVGNLRLYFYDAYNKKEIVDPYDFTVKLDVQPTNAGERLIQDYQIFFSESKIEGYTPLYISQGGIGYPIIRHSEGGYFYGKEVHFFDRHIDDDAIVFCVPSDVAIENYDCEHDITDVRIAVADSVKELRTLNFDNNENKYIHRGDSFDTEFFSVEIDGGTMAESYFTYGSTKSPICSIKMTKNLLVQSGKYIRIEFCIENLMWQDFGVFYVEDNPEWTSEDTTVNGVGLLQFAETLNPPRADSVIDGENVKLFDFFKEFNNDGKYVYSEYFEFVSNLYSDYNTFLNKKYLTTPYILEPYEYEENTFEITIEDAVKECVRGTDFGAVRQGIIDIYNEGEDSKTYKEQCQELSAKTGYAYDWVWFMFETSVNYTRKGEEFNSFCPSYIEMSLREYMSHLAVSLHCNVVERNGVLYFEYVDKNSYSILGGEKPFNADCYTEEPTRKVDSYISPYPVTVTTNKVSHMTAYKSNGDVWFQFYGKLDDTTDILLFEDGDVSYKTYPVSIISEPSYFNIKSSDKIVTSTSYIRDAMDLANANKAFYYYPISGVDFIGWNPLLYSGGFVKIDFDGIVRNVYIGNSTLYWDGGASVQISTPCEVNVSGNETSYSTGGSVASSSAGSVISSAIANAIMDGTLFRNGSIEGSVFKDGTIDNSKIKDSTITGSKINFSTFESGVISGSAIDTSTFTDGQISGSVIDTSTFKDGTIKGSVIESSTLKNIPFASMDKAFVNDLTSNSIFTDSVKATVIDVGALTADEADLKYATITSLSVVDGKINTLSSKAITTDNLSANVAKLGYLSTDSAEIAYAKVDFSNVGSQVVKSSMIVDGAVTNEKVENLSANKITSGTIDASKITVTNLNADNLTVGTINGKLIGKGSVDLNKLSEEVPTKEYLDSVQENLQGQIDGAIETFTKTEIPTLNNEPASLWADNATKKKHIGDICYVVNPTSSADGYCYRFANLGTEATPDYSWVLIKDSDVTKALQDIIDINGEITGIKKFDTEISSWKTDTDSELSSLKTRTTTLETDMGVKVETSTFNELKQTVAENSSSITTLSNTVSKKADSSTVTALSNTVNTVKQTADSNTSSISSLQSTVSKKADSSTVTALSNRTSTLEQDLSGFKTTVSNTYTTKEDFNALEIGGRNLLCSSNLEIGGLNPINVSANNSNRVRTKDPIKVEGGHIYALTPFDKGKYAGIRCGIHTITEDGTGVKDSGWIQLTFGEAYYYKMPDLAQYCRIVFSFSKTSEIVTTDGTEIAENIAIDDVVSCHIKLEKGTKATDWTPAPEDAEESIESVATIATQTADKFEWLVSSGTSATNFTLTDRMATLIADTISLNGDVKVSGDMIVDGSITADKLDVTDLSALGATIGGFLITTAGLAKTYDKVSDVVSGKTDSHELQLSTSGIPSIFLNSSIWEDSDTNHVYSCDISKGISTDQYYKLGTSDLKQMWYRCEIGKISGGGISISQLDYEGNIDYRTSFGLGYISATKYENNVPSKDSTLRITALPYIRNTNDVSLTSYALQISASSGNHMHLGKQTIQAVASDDTATTLYLNSFGGNVSIDNLTSQDKIGIHSHIKFDNNICIYGTNSSGALRSNFQPVNSNNNCVIGYGSYSASEGTTNLYGNYIELTTKNPMHSNRPLKTLWSGAHFMGVSQVASLAEKVSEQLNGIVLVWSYYSSGAQDYYWNCIFIPKGWVSAHPGNGIALFLASGNAGYKYVYVNDTTVTGSSSNASSMTINGVTVHPENYVLRYIYGV